MERLRVIHIQMVLLVWQQLKLASLLPMNIWKRTTEHHLHSVIALITLVRQMFMPQL